MKILIATGIFPPDIGGPAIYVERLANKLSQRNLEVVVITYAGGLNSNPKTKKYDFSVIRVSRRYPKGLRHFLYFLHLLNLAKDSDVIYAQNLTSAGFPSILASKILRKKLVIKVVGNYAWEQSSMRGWFSGRISEFHKAKTFKIKLLKRMQEALAKRANLIVVPCNYLKKSINSWGVPENKIQLIYNAPKDLLSLDIFNKDSQEEIKSDGKTILSIGRLDSWKGFHCLIEITKDLLQEIPNLKLLIIGEGDERKNLEFKIKKLGLGDKVKLVGRVSHEEIPLFFKKSDIFILNSAQEGFAHVILESMQLGVPVITTNEGGNPELIEDGVNGILVEYNNKEQLKKAIIKLINDKNLKQKFIENSKIKLKKFSWENLVNETLKALKP